MAISAKELARKRAWYHANKDKHQAARKKNDAKLIRAGEKYCPGCERTLPIDAFQNNGKDFVNAHCKSCRCERRNLDVAKVSMHKRMERQKNLPNTLTKQEWKYIKATFKHRCAYCGKPLERPTLDHFIPVARGGGTTKKNVVPACKSCNSKKGQKMPQDFLSEWNYKHIVSILGRFM